MSAPTLARPRHTLGTDAPRPDGEAKVSGRFAYSSDLRVDGMLWGATVRSPYASARILAIDPGPALALPGVVAVVTAQDVGGSGRHGLSRPDQPVLAADVVRHHGEPIAAVAATSLALARRAATLVAVTYASVDPLVDPDAALAAPPLHPDGNVYRHLVVRHGAPEDPLPAGLVSVEGSYEVGMQDSAFLGPESGLATPTEHGVDLAVSTQFLHSDRDQIAAALGLDRAHVRLTLAGVGGAFGGREDLSLHLAACLLARRTGRPVGMRYDRAESFLGHVHRHPARLWYRHTATPEGDLVRVEARVLLDGGAYASTSAAVLGNAVCFAAGPYRVCSARIEGWAVRTNNPPCGAMRGFGCVQTCFGHESQMDALAAALDMDPLALRLRNALEPGDRLITGQRITGAAPVRACLTAAAALPLPPPLPADPDPLTLPGGAGLSAQAADVRRGVGLAVGFKNLMFSEGFDDYSTASVRVEIDTDGELVATVHCAAAEVGQGFVTLAGQIVRSELGIERVALRAADTAIGEAGSSSASRQTWMSGGAIASACAAVRERAGAGPHLDARHLRDGPIEETRVFRHAPTQALDDDGQGDAHVSFVFAATRVVVDVDPELGSVNVVQVATGQDVGRALNPLSVTGQIEGGIAQGLGLALFEELRTEGGVVVNASLRDYLLPTTLDVAEVVTALVEQPEPDAPFGAKGVGEIPTIPITPAIVAAIRDATGRALRRVPVRPADIALGEA